MGFFRKTQAQVPAAKPQISIPEGTTAVNLVTNIDLNRRTDQIGGAIGAASRAVGKDMPDFPKRDTLYGNQDGTRLKYQIGAIIYDANKGVGARVEFEEATGLVFMTLQGPSMRNLDTLLEELHAEGLNKPEISYHRPQNAPQPTG